MLPGLDSPLRWRVYTCLYGWISRQTGRSIKTIRYYEGRGLLEPPPRTEGGYRLYGPEEVARLRFVQRAKLLGLTLEEIGELVELAVRSAVVRPPRWGVYVACLMSDVAYPYCGRPAVR